MYVNTHILKINAFSLCKYYYGINMHDFPLEDVRKAIERIGEDLNIPMDKVIVTRLDLAMDLELQRSPIEYFNRMLDLPYFRCHSYSTGSALGDRLLRQCYMILAFGMICWIGSYLVIPKSR